jgi:hypothetical protein
MKAAVSCIAMLGAAAAHAQETVPAMQPAEAPVTQPAEAPVTQPAEAPVTPPAQTAPATSPPGPAQAPAQPAETPEEPPTRPLDWWYLGVGVNLAAATPIGDRRASAAATDEIGVAYGGGLEIVFEWTRHLQLAFEAQAGKGPQRAELARETFGAEGDVGRFHRRIGGTARWLLPLELGPLQPFVVAGAHYEQWVLSFQGDDPACPTDGDAFCEARYTGLAVTPGLGIRYATDTAPTTGRVRDLVALYLQVGYGLNLLDFDVEPSSALTPRDVFVGDDGAPGLVRVQLGAQYLF